MEVADPQHSHPGLAVLAPELQGEIMRLTQRLQQSNSVKADGKLRHDADTKKPCKPETYGSARNQQTSTG